jgi:nucleoid-associated protein YgaU
MMDKGELKKLLIEAYTSPKYDDDGPPVDSYSVMFNPAGYSQKYEIEYHDAQGKGTSGSPQVYGKIKPREYTFEFLIDGTGVSSEKKEVQKEIEKFLTVTGKHEGDIHRPKYLKISWGSLLFKCVLKSADITINLFNPDGTPIRAKITSVFSENIEDTLRAAKEKNTSSDLTHYRIVSDGDKLPFKSYKIYKDHTYYLLIARFNKLKNFRKLNTGDRLIYPPVKKATNE